MRNNTPEEVALIKDAIKRIHTGRCRDCGKDGTLRYYRPKQGGPYDFTDKEFIWTEGWTTRMSNTLVGLCEGCAPSFHGEPKIFLDFDKQTHHQRAQRYKWLSLTERDANQRALYLRRFNEEMRAHLEDSAAVASSKES